MKKNNKTINRIESDPGEFDFYIEFSTISYNLNC